MSRCLLLVESVHKCFHDKNLLRHHNKQLFNHGLSRHHRFGAFSGKSNTKGRVGQPKSLKPPFNIFQQREGTTPNNLFHKISLPPFSYMYASAQDGSPPPHASAPNCKLLTNKIHCMPCFPFWHGEVIEELSYSNGILTGLLYCTVLHTSLHYEYQQQLR